jgi:pullulanase-type alpha-1,6-glucosidase
VKVISRRQRAGALISATALVAGLIWAQSASQASADEVPLVAGSFQSYVTGGVCSDWKGDCGDDAVIMESDGEDMYQLELTLPAGSYEYKIVDQGSWYGVGGKEGTANIPLSLTQESTVIIFYNQASHEPSIQLVGADLKDGYGDGDANLAKAPEVDQGGGNQFYFVLTDRFADGNPDNNTSYVDKEGKFTTSDDPMKSGYNPANPGFYQGGDIQGISKDENLDYIKNLGTTAIWLSPSFVNKPVQGTGNDASAGYHGYWITDFEHIDPHLGGDEALIELIAKAHAKGMKVYFDIIANHTADNIQYDGYKNTSAPYVTSDEKPYRDASGNTFDPADYADGQNGFPTLNSASFPYTPESDGTVMNPPLFNDVALYHNRGTLDGDLWNQAGEWTTWGDFSSLDDLMTENPAVVEAMIDIYKAWMDLGIDGFRIDTVKHVNFEFWELFTAAIKDYQETAEGTVKENFFTFGEIYDQDIKNSTSPYMRETDMNAVLDFPLAFGVRNYAKGGSGQDLANLFAADDYYTTGHSDAQDLVTFLDNHDMGRFPYLLKSEGVTNDLFQRVQVANDLLYLTRGQPVVYYGDEQGFIGNGNDKLAREDMFANQASAYQSSPIFGDDCLTTKLNCYSTTLSNSPHYSQETALYQQIAKLGAQRQDNNALTNGAQITLASKWSAYAFSRVDAIDKVENVVAINSGNLAVENWTFTTLTRSATYEVYYSSGTGGPTVDPVTYITSNDKGEITLTVPAYGAVALRPVSDGQDKRQTVSAPLAQLTDGTDGTFEVTPGLDFNGAGSLGLIQGVAPITANAPAGAWSQTSFWVRPATTNGTGEWTWLGTDTGPDPRVFDDASHWTAGQFLEYRAVNCDADNHCVANSYLAAVGANTSQPEAQQTGLVVAAGDFGIKAGCSKNWDPACVSLRLEPDAATGLYKLTVRLDPSPTGTFSYKIAINGTWYENYGRFGVAGGDNKTFSWQETDKWHGGDLTIWYDPVTHYFSETAQGIYTVSGNFLGELSEAVDADCDDWNGDWTDGNWAGGETPSCMAAWMHEDSSKPGQYVWSTAQLPPGTYQAKVLLYRSQWRNIASDACKPNAAPVVGDGGGYNCQFTVKDGQVVTFYLDTNSLDQGNNAYTSIVVADSPAKGVDLAKAYWIDQSTIAWPTALLPQGTALGQASWSLATAAAGGIKVVAGALQVEPGRPAVQSFNLTRAGSALSGSQAALFPALKSGYVPLKLPPYVTTAQIKELLRGETVVVARGAGGALVSLTATQNAGVIDDIYAAPAKAAVATTTPLGVSWIGNAPTFRLWAPTAQPKSADGNSVGVRLCLYADAEGTGACQLHKATYDDATGIWTVGGQSEWVNRAYDWQVRVYALEWSDGSSSLPYDGIYDNNRVVDAYAVGLTVDSQHAVVVNPSGYNKVNQPLPAIPSVDQTIYEIQVRDFSLNDAKVDTDFKGTYEAFTNLNSNGMTHLKALAEAGLTTVHLLPTYDIASIPEQSVNQASDNPGDGQSASAALAAPAPTAQPIGNGTVADNDAFNWGYDPLHWMAPEGSYATADSRTGLARNQQFAAMVQALHSIGLKVVLDQVYNHTYASGQLYDNVLDQAVPGYYHRLNAVGAVEKSICCDEIAAEHAMAAQLIVDSVVTWAKDYGVDGFRFDLMGSTPRTVFKDIQQALAQEATRRGLVGATEADGQTVDPVYYLYGEGWNFGSTSNNRLFFTAVQGQLNGTGIGTFSDRLRDAVVGAHSPLYSTGFATGNPNSCSDDTIRQGLAGNLYDYEFAHNCGSHEVGYASQPSETVTYVDAHDNQTLYDMLAMRLPAGTSMDDRIRRNTLALATVTLAQTPSFWHGGTDLLRSKSLDPNSYNSGDLFNLIDWTGADNAWGVGLPPTTERDGTEYGNPGGLMQTLLSYTDSDGNSLKPTADDAEAASAMAQELLLLRSTYPLFRLGSTELINDKLTFQNSIGGEDTVLPGFIPMLITDPPDDDIDVDPKVDAMLVVFNANNYPVTNKYVTGVDGRNFILSDITANGKIAPETNWDSSASKITIPPLSVAVLIEQSAVSVEAEIVAENDTGDPPTPITTAQLGQGLKANITYQQPETATRTYQWQSLCPAAEGEAEAADWTTAETNVTGIYTVVDDAYIGCQLRVRVTATAPNDGPSYTYTTKPVTITAATVGYLTGGSVRITGLPRTGLEIKAVMDAGNIESFSQDNTLVSPTPALTYSYQWTSAGENNGDAIETSDPTDDIAYTVTASDVGQSLSVVVTVKADGYETLTLTAPAVKAALGVASLPELTVSISGETSSSGAPLLGATLTADFKGLPSFDPTVNKPSYQWYSGGRVVTGDNGDQQTHRVVASDLGKSVIVKVTVPLNGYANISRVSSAVKPVRS